MGKGTKNIKYYLNSFYVPDLEKTRLRIFGFAQLELADFKQAQFNRDLN